MAEARKLSSSSDEVPMDTSDEYENQGKLITYTLEPIIAGNKRSNPMGHLASQPGRSDNPDFAMEPEKVKTPAENVDDIVKNAELSKA